MSFYPESYSKFFNLMGKTKHSNTTIPDVIIERAHIKSLEDYENMSQNIGVKLFGSVRRKCEVYM